MSDSLRAFASRLVPLAITLVVACAGDADPPNDGDGGSAATETSSSVRPEVDLPASDNRGGLTDRERACLEEWRERSLPPQLEVAVPPELRRQPVLRTIVTWDGQVVALAWNRAYRVDVESASLIRVDVPPCPTLLDLGESADRLFALCSKRGDPYVVTRTKAAGSVWELTLALAQDDFLPTGPLKARAAGPWGRLAVSDGAVAVVGTEAFWWRSVEHPEWTKRELALPDPPRVLDSKTPPDAAALVADALLVAWDHGEFGHWFYRIEIDPGGAVGQPTPVAATAVKSIVAGDGGVVWVAAGAQTGLAAEGQVLTLEGRTVRKILDESALRCELPAPGLGLPQPAEIDGLTLDGDGRPLVLAGDLGVFRIDGEALVPVIRQRMIFEYRNDVGTIVRDAPVGIVATERGIFVASRSLGVLAFLERDGEYELSQIVRH